MSGPMPKDPALRQRRNKATTRSALVAEIVQRKRAPRLPRAAGIKWHAMTRAWWRDVWHSPMAAEYLRADMHGLYRLAMLVNRFWEFPGEQIASEIRLQQQAFGLTPLDRRRLEWSIEQVKEASTRRDARKVRQQAQVGDADPREALRLVK